MLITNNSDINYNSLYFASRNKVIRRADDIVRCVNSQYPRISSSNIGDFSCSDKFEKLLTKLNKLSDRIREVMFNLEKKAVTDEDKLSALPYIVKMFKMGNCGESAILSAIAARVNGLKNFSIAKVCSSHNGDLDHSVVIVRGKNPYVLDAWLGFADYLPQAVQKYKGEFSYHFNFSNKEDEKISFVPYYDFRSSLIMNTPKKQFVSEFKELKIKQPKRSKK